MLTIQVSSRFVDLGSVEYFLEVVWCLWFNFARSALCSTCGSWILELYHGLSLNCVLFDVYDSNMLDFVFICIAYLWSSFCQLLIFIYFVHFGSQMFDLFGQIHFSGLLDMLLLLLELACWFDWFLCTSPFCVFHFRFYAINSLDLDAVWFLDLVQICRSSLYCCLLNSDPIKMLHMLSNSLFLYHGCVIYLFIYPVYSWCTSNFRLIPPTCAMRMWHCKWIVFMTYICVALSFLLDV